jgi:hypothetical protein
MLTQSCYILDTVGMLARVVGGEHFYPIAEEWIKISLVRFAMLLYRNKS